MEALLKITETNGQKAVSARELYNFLGYDKSQWARWYQKNILDNEFAFENIDYQTLDIMSKTNNGGRPTKDFALSLEFAKKLSMMARTEKGEQARQYFIACEKQLQQYYIPQNYSEALKLAYQQAEEIEKHKQTIETQKPKVLFADAVAASHTSILIGELAKILHQNGVNIGQNRLFEWMRENGYLIARKGVDFNMPTQRAMELGLFEIKETTISHADGHISISKTPKVKGKGQTYFINKFLSVAV